MRKYKFLKSNYDVKKIYNLIFLSLTCILSIIATPYFSLFLFIYIIFLEIKCKNNAKINKNAILYNQEYNKFLVNGDKILKSSRENYALIHMDIYKFKYINEVFGYDIGNKTLICILFILKKQIKKNELFSRIHGDHFILLIKYKSKNDIINRISKINEEISNIDFLQKHKYNILANYGVYRINSNTTSLNEAKDMAEIALNSVKGTHKSSIGFFNNEMKKKILEEAAIESDMNLALENNEFKVYLQAKYSLNPLKICGAEALIRWIHPEKGIIYPGSFIPVFEKNRFIINIDMLVFEMTCKTIKTWLNKGLTPIPISVNQSKTGIFSKGFITNIKYILEKYNIPPEYIEIEITESSVFDNIEKLIQIIYKLKEIGIKVSLDDFGAGYSSLNTLKDIPVDILKIDREFFKETSNNEKGQIVISTIISMAKSLNIKIVAEGVETLSQSEFLKSIKCDMVQGYLYSKPVTVEEFEKSYLL